MKSYALILLVVLCFAACTVKKQGTAINNARLAVAALGIGSEAANKGTAAYYASSPASNDETYCRNKIAKVVFAQIDNALEGAADKILLWEQLLVTYLSKKDEGKESDADLQNVKLGQSVWKDVAKTIVSILNRAVNTFKSWDVPIPHELEYGLSVISAIAGVPEVDFEFDFKELKESICIDYLPGGDR